jgi:hypothetical protein
MSESLVNARWDSGERAVDDDNDASDYSDSEFEMHIYTDSSDDDVQELRNNPVFDHVDE